MNKKHLFFAALFFAALAFGFVGCENPDDESGTLMENPDDNIDNDVEYRLEAFSNNEEMGIVECGSGIYRKGTEVTIIAVPFDSYHLCTWSDCDTKDLERKIVINSDTVITAIFSDNPYLSVKSNNMSYGTVSGSGTYEIGSEVIITAKPEENYYFLSWSDCDSKELTRTVVVNTDSTIIANFAKKPKLVAKPNNASYGTVTGSGYYDVGTKVTITAATKGEHCYFNGWSDCDSKELTREVVITSDTTIIANFTADLYLNVRSSSTFGTVTGSGYYEVGTKVTITATPKENYYFTGWSDSDSKELTRTVQVNSNKTITAKFAKKPYLTAKPNSSGYGTVTGTGYYEPNTEVTITATPKEYTEFVQWSDGNTENPRTITVTSNVTYTATFKVNLPDGAFLVDDSGKCVYFSSGNLQYHPANNEWRFAPSQLDYIGASNSNCSSTYNGWLDLFGWSTSATNFGVSTSTSKGDYSGSFVDWGANQIGSDAPNTWRTLTYNEWGYVVFDRPKAGSLRGVARVNGVNGLILLPDSWTCPDGITFKSGSHSYFGVNYYADYQTFTAAEWSKMEVAGAVFLPAAGSRDGSALYYVQNCGYYWSATEYDSTNAYYLYFSSDEGNRTFSSRDYGRSVRLVKDL